MNLPIRARKTPVFSHAAFALVCFAACGDDDAGPMWMVGDSGPSSETGTPTPAPPSAGCTTPGNDDADQDGLTDAEECSTFGTDPRVRDTDGDGVTDLGEVRGTNTDPRDPASTIPEGDFFVVLPYQGDPVHRTLRFGTNITVADLYFLIDTTGSMDGAITNVQSSLQQIALDVAARVPDIQMGVGRFDDFPGGLYGSAGDVAYENVTDITADTDDVQRGLDSLAVNDGGDVPESQVQALYQTATGVGGTWMLPGLFGTPGMSYSIAPRTCPSVLDEPGSRFGYPCFRAGSLPIIVLVSDAAWHNGPPELPNEALYDYAGFSPDAQRFEDAVGGLAGIGARFIGVSVDRPGNGRLEMEEMARRTGTVDAEGNPLVYVVSDGTVSTSIVDAIGQLTTGVPQDVTTTTRNVPGNPDELDARAFVGSIVPVEGIHDGAPGGYASKDDVAFYQVVPGTLVEFDVELHNDVRPPPASAEIFHAIIVVLGNGVATLDSRNVYIVVPPEGGVIFI